MPTTPKTSGSRFLLIVAGVCLCLLLAEAGLRVGALFGARGVAGQSAWPRKWRMLCLGDSNTYALFVDRSQAYPTVFESMFNWSLGKTNREVEVLNLGFPGTNSSNLAKDFRRMLWTFHPDVVTVMIGYNNLSTIPNTAEPTPTLRDQLSAALWRRSRVYRLLPLARPVPQGSQLEVMAEPSSDIKRGRGIARYGTEEFELGWTKLPEGGIPGWQPDADFQLNLETMAAHAAEFGTKLIFLTYAADSAAYSWANAIIRRAANASATPLIDVAAIFKPSCPAPAAPGELVAPVADCPELFPNQHPTAIGHQRVARILAQQLMQALSPSH